MIWRHPWIPRAEPAAFLMHNGLERSNWWELKSQVQCTAVCPCCLLGNCRSCFASILNINLIHKPHSGCLESQSLLWRGQRTMEYFNTGKHLSESNLLVQLSFATVLFDPLATGLKIVKIFNLQKLHSRSGFPSTSI